MVSSDSVMLNFHKHYPCYTLTGIMQASIRMQLVKEEAKVSANESELQLHPDVSLSILIGTGIDLEDQQ